MMTHGVMVMTTMMVAGRGKGRRRNQHQQAGNRELPHGSILAQSQSTP
jgi:hypothetical protein